MVKTIEILGKEQLTKLGQCENERCRGFTMKLFNAKVNGEEKKLCIACKTHLSFIAEEDND